VKPRTTALATCALVIAAFSVPLPAHGSGAPEICDRTAIPPLTEEECSSYVGRAVEYITRHHLVKDPNCPQFGMVYEYYTPANGRWEEGEGLDTMHDGAWWMDALAHLYRATGDAKYLEWIKKYSIPFYVNVLNNSDRLFPNPPNNKEPKHRLSDAEHEIFFPEKGWCPYWWSDGSAFSIEAVLEKTGDHPYPCWSWYWVNNQPNPERRLKGHACGTSNHMAQDLAAGVLSAWVVTGDPGLASAAKELYLCRERHSQFMAAAATAALATNPEMTGVKPLRVPDADNQEPGTSHYYRLYAGFRPWSIMAHIDDVFYYYTAAYTGRAKAQVNLGYAQAQMFQGVGYALLEEIWRDGPCTDRKNSTTGWRTFAGKFVALESQTGNPMRYSRMEGNEAFLMAHALELLKAFPSAWEHRYNAYYPKDTRVFFVDPVEDPKLDGKPDASYGQPVVLGQTKVQLVSGLRALYVLAQVPSGESLSFRVHAKPDTKGTYAEVLVKKDGAAELRNYLGEPGIVKAAITPLTGEAWTAEIQMPYSFVRDQGIWANGTEHGRLSLAVGDASVNLYPLSSPQRVEKVLNRNLAEIVRFWFAMYDRPKIGYLPESWRLKGGVSRYSDSGCNAHLMRAMAHYLCYLKGKADWRIAQELMTKHTPAKTGQ